MGKDDIILALSWHFGDLNPWYKSIGERCVFLVESEGGSAFFVAQKQGGVEMRYLDDPAEYKHVKVKGENPFWDCFRYPCINSQSDFQSTVENWQKAISINGSIGADKL